MSTVERTPDVADLVIHPREHLKVPGQLTDDSLMPFGKYKGKKMMDVPASYFHWLWTNERDPMSRKAKVDPVAGYIERNMDGLKQEHPDGIW